MNSPVKSDKLCTENGKIYLKSTALKPLNACISNLTHFFQLHNLYCACGHPVTLSMGSTSATWKVGFHIANSEASGTTAVDAPFCRCAVDVFVMIIFIWGQVSLSL